MSQEVHENQIPVETTDNIENDQQWFRGVDNKQEETSYTESIADRAKDHSFVCRHCQAINKDVDIQTKMQLVHTKDMQGGFMDGIRVTTGQYVDDIPTDDIMKVARSDSHEFEQVVVWTCEVCGGTHEIPDMRDT